MKTLEEYLRENFAKGIIDHKIRTNDGESFYIHPDGYDGGTLDFAVNGNALKPLHEQSSDLPVDLSEIRRKFIAETEGFAAQTLKRTRLVVAVKLPTGATEIIINTEQLESKIEYYRNAYDDDFCLKANPVIQIVGYMLV